MNILVTGANGFIGRRLSSRLIEQGHYVTGLSLKIPSDPPIAFKNYYQQDLTRPFVLNDPFDIVIHLAAYNITNVGAKDRELYTAINVGGTQNLLQGVRTKKFIYLSTTKVYKNEGRPITEESSIAPQGAYEQSKLKAEEVCSTFLKNRSLVILRSVNVIGWGQAPKAVLPVFFQKARANQPLDIINTALTPMQFVYVEDLIDVIEAVIRQEDKSGIFNIAHPETISLEQLALEIIAITHSSSVLNIKNDATEILLSPVICYKAQQQLGWKAKTGLIKVLKSYQDQYARVA